jgi:predicted transcriptional regulator
MPQVDGAIDVAEVYRYLMAGYSGVIIANGGHPHGLLTRIDLADFWAKKAKEKEGILMKGRAT